MRAFKFEISNLRRRRAAFHYRRSVACSVLLAALCFSTTALCSPHAAYSSWVKQKTGTFAWLHAVFFVDERRGWAVGGKGALLSTTDGGEHWEVKRPPTEDALQDLFFTDARTGWIVCVRSIYLPMRKDEPRSYLLQTSNGGETWTRVEVASEDVDVELARVRFADGEHGWVFGEMGALYATADGGRTWARRRVPTRHLLLGATLLDAQQGWLVGAGATALQTTDGGATWRAGQLLGLPAQPLTQTSAQTPAQSRATPVRLNAVSFADARRGWAVGAGGVVLATADGGRTWRAQDSGVESDLFDVKFLDEREGWAVGGDGTAIHTADGGETWRAEPTGTPHALERLCFAGRARGWAVGFGGTIITLTRG
jgi:photosystem II stability/assembly factor-like uncharacterized protein